MIIRIRQTPGLALFGLALFALLVLSSCARQGGSEESAGRQNDRVREDTAVQTVSEESSRSPTEAAPRERASRSERSKRARTAGRRKSKLHPPQGKGASRPPLRPPAEEGAARTIAEVRFGRHQGYERAVIEFDSPRVPRWSLSTPLGEGYSRISLPDIETARQTGGDFGGQIMADYYVVRNPQGGFFVDVFATGPFRYRLLELQNPGRLVLDYAPAGGPGPAAAGAGREERGDGAATRAGRLRHARGERLLAQLRGPDDRAAAGTGRERPRPQERHRERLERGLGLLRDHRGGSPFRGRQPSSSEPRAPATEPSRESRCRWSTAARAGRAFRPTPRRPRKHLSGRPPGAGRRRPR